MAMNYAIVEAIQQLIRDRNIDREVFQELIESVFLAIIKKKFGSTENFDVIFNLDKGDIEIYCEKTVVPDGELADPVLQIELSKAQEFDPEMELGEVFVEIIDYRQFGRRLITSAKQNLAQKIKEIEKENIFTEYSDRVGEIIIGEVHQINRREIRLYQDKVEVIMPRQEQIYSERYRRGDSVRAIVKSVERTSKDPEIIVSRADPKFVKRLFELEVPEIYDGIIEIKNIAREPGDRTKIAVISNDKRIDPVGACVGMKGIRIQAIVRELNNEKIDIIHWSPDSETYIKRALSPVTPASVTIDPETKHATVVISDDQMSMAIGRHGQNIRLASVITGYDIEPIKESEFFVDELDLDEVEGLSSAVVAKLREAGLQSAEDVLDAGKDKLMEIKGVGEKTAEKILETVGAYFEE
jgi:N utilization substance protein A